MTPVDGDRTRESWIGIGATALAVVAMAIDHLAGDDPGLEDPGAFALASGLSAGLALFLFGRVVPRATAGAEAARTGLVLSVLALISTPVALWLGLPFVLAAAGVALGLVGRQSERRWRVIAAIAIGAIVLTVGTAAYAVEAVDKLL